MRKFQIRQLSIGTWEILGYPLRVVRSRAGSRWIAEVVNKDTNIILATEIDDFPRKAIKKAVIKAELCQIES